MEVGETGLQDVWIIRQVILPPGRDEEDARLFIPLPTKGLANLPETFQKRLGERFQILTRPARREREDPDPIGLCGEYIHSNELFRWTEPTESFIDPDPRINFAVARSHHTSPACTKALLVTG